MERLIDKVPQRCYYYLLDWNEQDEKVTLKKEFNKFRLVDLSVDEFWILFEIATKKEIANHNHKNL